MSFSKNYPNKIIKIPRESKIIALRQGDIPDYVQNDYDEYYFNPLSMSWVKIENQHEIERLKNELYSKKEKLKSLVSYYYNRK